MDVLIFITITEMGLLFFIEFYLLLRHEVDARLSISCDHHESV